MRIGGGSGGGGGSSAFSREISSLSGSATPNVYANDKTYMPLVRSAGDDVVGGFISEYTGNVEIAVVYAMSSSNGGDVELTFAHSECGTGDDPSAALTSEAAFVVTPGANTTVHTIDSGDHAVLLLAVTAGDDVTVQLTRTVAGNDTHTGDFRILRMLARQV